MKFEEGLAALREGKQIIVLGETWEMKETAAGNIITASGYAVTEINLSYYIDAECEIKVASGLWWRRAVRCNTIWVTPDRWYKSKEAFMHDYDMENDGYGEWECREFEEVNK